MTTEFKLRIQDVFNILTRQGPVVLGQIESGSVRVDDTLFLQSSEGNIPVKVVGIEQFHRPGLLVAFAGPDDVSLEITGVQYSQIRSGDYLL